MMMMMMRWMTMALDTVSEIYSNLLCYYVYITGCLDTCYFQELNYAQSHVFY